MKDINQRYWALEHPDVPQEKTREMLLEAIAGKTPTVFHEYSNSIIYSVFDVSGDNAAAQLNPYHIRLACDGTSLFATLHAVGLQDDVGMSITKISKNSAKRVGAAIFRPSLHRMGLGTQLDMATIDYALLTGLQPEDIIDGILLKTAEAQGFSTKLSERIAKREVALRDYLL